MLFQVPISRFDELLVPKGSDLSFLHSLWALQHKTLNGFVSETLPQAKTVSCGCCLLCQCSGVSTRTLRCDYAGLYDPQNSIFSDERTLLKMASGYRTLRVCWEKQWISSLKLTCCTDQVTYLLKLFFFYRMQPCVPSCDFLFTFTHLREEFLSLDWSAHCQVMSCNLVVTLSCLFFPVMYFFFNC